MSHNHATSTRRLLAATLSALVVVPLAALSHSAATAAAPAARPAPLAATDFRGVNWAMPGDNFTDGPVVPEGLSESDSYDTVRAKATAIVEGFESTIDANTVRLPINVTPFPARGGATPTPEPSTPPRRPAST